MQAARSWLCHAEVRDFEAWMQNVRSAAQTQASELARSPSWQALGQTSHSQFSHAEIYITPPLLLIIGAVALSQACELAKKKKRRVSVQGGQQLSCLQPPVPFATFLL